jgi:isopenicillin-N epimerase
MYRPSDCAACTTRPIPAPDAPVRGMVDKRDRRRSTVSPVSPAVASPGDNATREERAPASPAVASPDVNVAPPDRVVEGVPIDWSRRRELFSLDDRVAHLNHGSFGAVPIPVRGAQRRLRDEMDANPMAFFSRGLLDRLAHTRGHLAGFVGTGADGVALVPNATAAATAILHSIPFARGEEILLTDHGYGAVRIAADEVARRYGASVREVELPLIATDDEVLNRITDAVTPGRTRLAFVDHVTSPTAKLLPVHRIVAELRSRHVLVAVDAAHAPGMLEVDIDGLAADFWLGNLHKWAFAPRPTALLGVAAEHRSSMRPLVVSWEQQHGFPRAQEFAGTLDYTAWLAAPAGVHLLRTLGLEQVRTHNADLAAQGQRLVASAVAAAWPTSAVGAPAHTLVQRAQDGTLGDPSVSMRLVPLPPDVATDRAVAVDLRTRIAELGVEVAMDAWRGQGFLRLSAQVYNRIEDYDRLAHALALVLPTV